MKPPRRTSASLLVVLACSACHSTSASKGDSAGAFRDTFAVDPRTLRPDGAAAYFSLVPGDVHVYLDGDERLTITVLDETRVVDGVTTRVVEERETKGKELKEVSRNFFAMDPATGDAYYFGEEVDLYEGGQISGHEGAWQSGVAGARFGLMMPGHPVAGDRHYQELAPGVAMDRAEIVSADEHLETPGRIFEHCVHVRETSPLERGVSHKWYAPGVGLVRDGDSVIVPR